MLEGFKVVSLKKSKRTIPYLSISKYGINFNRASLEKMNYSKFVLIQINYNKNLIAVVESEDDENAISFAKSKSVNVRINNREFTEQVKNLLPLDVLSESDSYRIVGKYFQEHKALIFDLNTAKPIISKNR